MITNLSIRWKIFLGFGIILLLLAVVSLVSIISFTKISSNSRFIKDTAFRQALYFIEVENLIKQLASDISTSVDAGTTEGIMKAAKTKEELDKKCSDAERIFVKDKDVLKTFRDIKDRADKYYSLGHELVRININQEWAVLGSVTEKYNGSRTEVFSLIAKLKSDGIKQLDVSLLEIVRLTKNTATATTIILIVAFLAGIALTFIISAKIVYPLQRLTEVTSAIASGDLTKEVKIESSDEIGALANAFNHMTKSLKDMVIKINMTFKSLNDVSNNLSNISHNISDGSDHTAGAVEKVYHFVGEMNKTIQNIARNMEDFSSTTEEMSSWILEMTSSIAELTKNAEILASAVNDTSSSIHQMSASINQVAKNISSLLELQTASSVSVTEINSSIKEVEGMTHNSAKLAEDVSKVVADRGISSVTKAVDGIGAISEIVNKSADVIKQLGESIENVSRIVSIIDEIADQTKLLSLNAAILAAQAGEHGRGFSVVADEIGSLSENTIRSTQEITELIATIKSESKEAVHSMIEGSKMSAEGVSLIKAVDFVLSEINKAASSSYGIAKKIAVSSAEQTQSGSFILRSIQDITSMCEGINKATNEQSSGINLVVEAAEKMRDISIMLKKTTEEQLSGSNRVAKAMDEAVVRSKHILNSIQGSNKENELLVRSIGEIQLIVKDSVESVSQMNSTVNILSQQAKLLEDELSRFRF